MTIPNAIREAARLIRQNPGTLEAIDAEEQAAAKAREAAAKRIAGLEDKVAKGLEARTEALIEDYVALQQDALRAAAAEVARGQLRQEVGLDTSSPFRPVPARLGQAAVERARVRLFDAAPLPWDRAGRSARDVRSAQSREIAEQRKAASPAREVDDVEQRRAEHAANLEQARQRGIAERKRKAREAGVLK